MPVKKPSRILKKHDTSKSRKTIKSSRISTRNSMYRRGESVGKKRVFYEDEEDKWLQSDTQSKIDLQYETISVSNADYSSEQSSEPPTSTFTSDKSKCRFSLEQSFLTGSTEESSRRSDQIESKVSDDSYKVPLPLMNFNFSREDFIRRYPGKDRITMIQHELLYQGDGFNIESDVDDIRTIDFEDKSHGDQPSGTFRMLRKFNFSFEDYIKRYNKNFTGMSVQHMREPSLTLNTSRSNSTMESSLASSSFADELSRSLGRNDISIHTDGNDAGKDSGSDKSENGSRTSVFELMRKYTASLRLIQLMNKKNKKDIKEIPTMKILKREEMKELFCEFQCDSVPHQIHDDSQPVKDEPDNIKNKICESELTFNSGISESNESKYATSSASFQMESVTTDSFYPSLSRFEQCDIARVDIVKDRYENEEALRQKAQGAGDETYVKGENKNVIREKGKSINGKGIETAENGLIVENKRSQDDEDEDCGSGWGYWLEYLMVLLVAVVLLLGCVFLVLFWCFYYRKGYNSWKVETYQQFNLHPTLMVGAVTFTGFSVLMYRIGRCSRRLYVKLLHATFHLLAILCFVGGFLSIFEWHNMMQLQHFYSLHSWIGFITMGLFGIQFLVGFVSFLVLLCCESATAGFRACLLPLHTMFGLTIFLVSIATCLTGLVQRTNSTIGEDYKSLPEEAIVINALGVALVAVGVAVTYALGRTSLRVKSDCYISERL